VSDQETKRARFRAEHPELAELVDMLRGLGCSPAVINITTHDGELIAGRPLKPLPPNLFEIDQETRASLTQYDRYIAGSDGKRNR
jgi:hypothetical protein